MDEKGTRIDQLHRGKRTHDQGGRKMLSPPGKSREIDMAKKLVVKEKKLFMMPKKQQNLALSLKNRMRAACRKERRRERDEGKEKKVLGGRAASGPKGLVPSEEQGVAYNAGICPLVKSEKGGGKLRATPGRIVCSINLLKKDIVVGHTRGKRGERGVDRTMTPSPV